MQLVYSFYIKHNEDIDKLCKVSTNLYNQALYIVRTTLDKEGKILRKEHQGLEKGKRKI